MSVVRTLTKEGMTIVATIHSPTPFCFNLFDRLMILIGGYAIYHGPNGNDVYSCDGWKIPCKMAHAFEAQFLPNLIFSSPFRSNNADKRHTSCESIQQMISMTLQYPAILSSAKGTFIPIAISNLGFNSKDLLFMSHSQSHLL